MLSLGWSEISIIVVILILVVGPKELPTILKQIGLFTKKIKKISREFNTTLNNITKEAEIDQIKKQINKVSSLDIKNEILEKTQTKTEFEDINQSFEKINKDIQEIDKDSNKNLKKHG